MVRACVLACVHVCTCAHTRGCRCTSVHCRHACTPRLFICMKSFFVSLKPGSTIVEEPPCKPQRRCGRVPAQMWASPGADVGESRRRCGRVPAQIWHRRGLIDLHGMAAIVRLEHDVQVRAATPRIHRLRARARVFCVLACVLACVRVRGCARLCQRV